MLRCKEEVMVLVQQCPVERNERLPVVISKVWMLTMKDGRLGFIDVNTFSLYHC